MQLTIFVTDDEPAIRNAIIKRLTRKQHRVVGFESGDALLAALRQEIPDLILLDLKMPGLSGLETLRKLRPLAPHSLIILLTAYGTVQYPFAQAKKDGNPIKLFRLPREVRLQRVKDALQALEILNGGAMQTCNLADVTPKLIVLTTLNSGNHLFSHLAKDDLGKPVFSLEALKQVVKDYSDRILGKSILGGGWDLWMNWRVNSKNIPQNETKIFYGSVNEAIREYVKEVEQQIP